jgi:aminopeptidase N
MKRILLSTLSFLMILGACDTADKQKAKEKKEMKQEEIKLDYVDHHSFSRPKEATVKHLNWKANVDFEKKIITATATYEIENIKGVDTIYLDSRNLKISEVRRNDHDGVLGYKAHDRDEFLGTELAIPITKETKSISIDYSTTKGADALQFLDPVQTAGKKHPFLFTQSQAILARTWLPCQDSPGVRFTYEAEVTVPKGMLALMSADNPTKVDEDGVYNFTMDQPVPSYLMALAVGDIAYQSIGEITGVYAEPSVIEAAAYEFAEMQHMVDTAEALYGDYRWGKYDVIVLPPSFPFGGMENPRLTFATPTIIAGDRSLTALIAHELAHSWSGNLVTNANWEDIWLNEGFTVYFENRIMEEIYGKDFANMLAILSYQDLKDEIEWLKSEGREADTRLKVDLEGRDPDDGLTGVPYDKGYYLLRLIEETIGREKWDAFLKEYFNKYAFEVMTTKGFLTYLNRELLDQNPEWRKAIRVDEWVYETGLPDNCPKVTSTKFAAVEKQLEAWKGGQIARELETKEWMTPEWMHFVRLLPDTMNEAQMKQLEEAFGFTTIGNSEIQAAWFEKVIPNNYKTANQPTEDFLIEVGRRKFLVPIYKSILKSEAGKERALMIYKKARPNYHAVSRETLDDLLGVKK